MVVAAAAAAPSKPTKTFPKKFDSEVHGLKDSSATHHAPDEDLVMPPLSPFDVLMPPMLPELAPLPEDSSYTGLGPVTGEDGLVPPPEDTYSSAAGEGHSALLPPPAVPAPEAPSSYLSFERPRELATSSYARIPSDASGTEVLASLAAMIQALPHISSYTSYQRTAPEGRTLDDGPARILLPPPSAQSSYSNVPAPQPQETQAREAAVPLPATGLAPPPQ